VHLPRTKPRTAGNFLCVSYRNGCQSLFVADSTGTESVFTEYRGYKIMFHVSTMLPFTPNNKQQVQWLLSHARYQSRASLLLRE